MRRFAIGDIHGCAKALRTLVEHIDPQPDDELIFLGDYIDRGPDSRNVIDQILELEFRCRVVPLVGNHELAMLAIIQHGVNEKVWLTNGGRATLTSYGGSLTKLPQSHLDFFRRLSRFHEMSDSICVHAGYEAELPMEQQADATMFWNHLPLDWPAPHVSGKRMVFGHTPQASGRILDAGHFVCIDTYCFGGGYLTALELDTNAILQANHHGHLRRQSTSGAIARGAKTIGRRLAAYWRRRRQHTNPVVKHSIPASEPGSGTTEIVEIE
jgi:serine/threonine protein phosphatase 1